jgi:hypothetical protein
MLQDYKILHDVLKDFIEKKDRNNESTNNNANSKMEDANSKIENRDSNLEFGTSSLENQSVKNGRAIPEIISENNEVKKHEIDNKEFKPVYDYLKANMS